jgi:trehalose synthase-fused probable maltokinase
VLKFVRRVEEGVNPGVELGRFLDERAGFPHAPRVAGSLELRLAGAAAPMTIALLDEYVPNEGDGWGYVVDLLTRGLEEAVTHGGTVETGTPPALATGHGAVDLPFGHFLLGPHLTWSTLLGRRVGELHRVLAVGTGDPDFAPESLTAADRQSMYHGARRQTRRTVRQSAAHADPEGRVAAVVAREQEVIERLRRLSVSPVAAQRMRVHGDLHLGQALWTGKDFVIIDFEGEPARSLVQRRAKRPAAFDVAAMVRSIHYASRAATMRLERDLTESFDSSVAERWADHWYRWVSWAFVDSYLDAVGGAAFLADDAAGVAVLLEFFLLEKAVSELDYEANHRPEWVEVPAQGILDLLDGPR